MKNQIVKRKLLIECLAIVIGLLVLSAALYFLSIWYDDKEQENRMLKTQEVSLQNEMQSLNNKYTSWRENNGVYQEAVNRSNKGDLTPNRNTIRSLFARYNDEFRLKNVSLQMAPIIDVPDPSYKRNTANMLYSEVAVDLEALTDLDVFRLIEAIEKDFAGKVKMLSVKITRSQPVSPDVLKQISMEGSAKMVTANLRFLWIGISQVEDKPKEKTNAGNP